MRNFLLNLSKNLNISQNNKIIGLHPKNSKISVLTNTFNKWQIFDGVISTLPAPQNLLLMQEFPILIFVAAETLTPGLNKQKSPTSIFPSCLSAFQVVR